MENKRFGNLGEYAKESAHPGGGNVSIG